MSLVAVPAANKVARVAYPGWDPRAASQPLTLWLRSDRAYQVGTGVSKWIDLSSAGNSASQSTGATQPTATAGTHATAKVSFSGTQGLECDSVLAAGAWTIFARYKLAATPGAGAYMQLLSFPMLANKTLWTEFFVGIGLPANNAHAITWAAGLPGSATGVQNELGFSPTLDTSAHRIIVTYSGGTATSAASYTALFDGVAKTVLAGGNNYYATTSTGSIGCGMFTAHTAGNGLNGDINEIGVFSGVISAGDIVSLDNMLATTP